MRAQGVSEPSHITRQHGAEHRPAERGARHIPAVEWAVAAMGALFVGATILFLLWDGLTASPEPMAIAIEAEAPRPVDGGWHVPVRARNESDHAAAEVAVRGTLSGSAGEAQESAITFDYVPARSERRGGLFFTENPEGRRLDLRVEGYRRP